MSNINISTGSGYHCCVCTGVCGHITPATYCAAHILNQNDQIRVSGPYHFNPLGQIVKGWECCRCAKINAPWLPHCDCKPGVTVTYVQTSSGASVP